MTNAQLQYAQEHNLTDTLISLQVLRQCRSDLPERKEVGKTSDGLRVLFEETQGSLLKRHYKYTDSEHATSWYEVAIGEKPNNAYNLALNILDLLEIEEV